MNQIDGAKLRAWRTAQRRSIENVAREIGISYVTLQRWETGKLKTRISPLGQQALAKIGYRE
ncbi:MAG TPA: hypothetical protein DCP69_04540 [Candidatus Omnitrophica bacterium]|nr:hypothetical protein [Candidatus Omnitrophota bacterium]